MNIGECYHLRTPLTSNRKSSACFNQIFYFFGKRSSLRQIPFFSFPLLFRYFLMSSDSKCKEQHEKWRHSSLNTAKKIYLLLLYEAKTINRKILSRQISDYPPFRYHWHFQYLIIHQQSKPHFFSSSSYYKCRYYKSAGHPVQSSPYIR